MENKDKNKKETKEVVKKCALCYVDIQKNHACSVLDKNGNFETVCYQCYKKSFPDGEWWY